LKRVPELPAQPDARDVARSRSQTFGALLPALMPALGPGDLNRLVMAPAMTQRTIPDDGVLAQPPR
jgi:hypothetical protein